MTGVNAAPGQRGREPDPAGSARPHRPELRADLTALLDAAGGAEAMSRQELAATTAAAVVAAGRAPDCDGERFVDLADRVGLDTLAQLWSGADPVSLAGALWALYLLRQWCRDDAEEVWRLWRAGEPYAPAAAVVAGVSEAGDVRAVHEAADAVLNGAYQGDFAVALERASALFAVIAAGRRETAAHGERGRPDREMADRNERVAADLATAARLWRAGALS